MLLLRCREGLRPTKMSSVSSPVAVADATGAHLTDAGGTESAPPAPHLPCDGSVTIASSGKCLRELGALRCYEHLRYWEG
jgi:hypothetical protein